MSYLEKLKAKTSPLEELPKEPKGFEAENNATPLTAKSARSPFDSFGSTAGRRCPENEEKSKSGLRIEPMTECLHGKQCRHLDAPGERRPLCRESEIHIFDLIACPFKHWTKSRDLKGKE